MRKEEEEEVRRKEVVMSVVKKIGCEGKVNEENEMRFKYEGEDLYIGGEEEKGFMMMWNGWWGWMNGDKEGVGYVKEIMNLGNVK